MVIPSINLRSFPDDTSTSCYTDKGTFLNAQNDIAFQFQSYCNSVSTYEGAFNACNTTRQSVSGTHFSQIKSWNSHRQVLYANATVPAPHLACLDTNIAAANHHNTVNAGIVAGSVIGGVAVIGALVGAVICCKKRRGRS